MLDSYRLSDAASGIRAALDTVRTLLADVEGVLDGAAETPEGLEARVDSLAERVQDLRREVGEASEGAGMWFRIQGFTAPPTADQLRAIDRSWELLPGLVERVNSLIAEELPPVLADVYQPDVRPAVPGAVPLPRRGG
jgi:ABC-type transporter Mla subunit MlaD